MNIKSILFFLLLLIATYCWNTYVPPYYQLKEAWYILVYFFMSTAFVHHQLINTNKKSPKNFIKYYMAATGLRLLLNLMIIAIFILVLKERAIVFTIGFMVYYLCYLVFEVVALITETNKSKNP